MPQRSGDITGSPPTEVARALPARRPVAHFPPRRALPLALLTTALIAVAPAGAAVAGETEAHSSSCRGKHAPPKEEAPPKPAPPIETPPPEAPRTPAPPAPIAPPAAMPPSPPPASPGPRARLEIVKSGPADLRAGGRASFVIRLHNVGAASARGVAVSDLLPGGFFVHTVAIRAATAPAGAWHPVRPRLSGGRLIISLGNLGAGRSALVRVTLGAQRSVRGRRCNLARVTAGNAPAAVARACLRVFRPPLVKAPPRVTG